MRLFALLLFLSSGACALIYEITWTRMLTLIFGSTTFAVSTILASFMAGFGIGSYFFGRFIDRHGEPLKVYGILELIIGGIALLFPFVVDALMGLNIYIHRELWPEASYFEHSVIKFVLYFTTILIPASLMGATFPIIVKFFVQGLRGLGTGVGTVYTVNTLGAVIGCLATGFILIRLLGQTTTTYWAAAANITIGITAIVVNAQIRKSGAAAEGDSHADKHNQSKAPPTAEADEPRPAIPPLVASVILFGFFMSGFCALAYEVLWTRMLVFAAGVTTYAFSAMLATFLCGLAIGSILFAKLVDKQKNLLVLFAVIQFAIGLTAYFGSQIVLSDPDFFQALTNRNSLEFADSWLEFSWRLFSSTASLMLVPTILMGATFPLVNKIYVSSLQGLGRDVGKAYLLNSLGSALGAMAVGFVVIPNIGISHGLLLIALINIALGGIVLAMAGMVSTAKSEKARSIPYEMISLGVCVVLAAPLLIVSFKSTMPALELGIRGALEDNFEVLSYKEGTSGTTTVVEHRARRKARDLFIEGFSAAGTSQSYNYMRMLGHLPMLLCDDPKDVLVIAFGTGTTSGTVGMYEHERFDIVELSEEVIDVAHYFESRNRNILEDDRTNLIIDDGRNHLLTTNRKYDVISLEPMPPYFPGAISLYTREFYEICKSRLTEKGVMCQWLPPHSQSARDQQGLLRAFSEVFPHTSLWFFEGTLAVIGTQQELSINLPDLTRRMQSPLVKQDLAVTGLDDPVAFLANYVMGPATIAKYVDDVEPVTDDHPYVEFFSVPKKPASFYQSLNCLDAIYRQDDIFPLLTGIKPEEEEALRIKLAKQREAIRRFIELSSANAARIQGFEDELNQSLKPLGP